MARRSGRYLRSRLALALLTWAIARQSAATDPAPAAPSAGSAVIVLGRPDASFDSAVRASVAQALETLESARCRELFSAFRKPGGQNVQEVLDELHRSPAQHLLILRYADARRQPVCQSSGVLAGTSPGSAVVLLCGARFVETRRTNPDFAVTIILHEALHTLGLAENPPSSVEINEIVREHCGR